MLKKHLSNTTTNCVCECVGEATQTMFATTNSTWPSNSDLNE